MKKLLNALNLFGIKKPKAKKFADFTLEFAFKTQDGHNIYLFPENKSLPLERQAEMMKILELISAGVDGDEIKAVTSFCNEIVSKQGEKALSKVLAALHTLELRVNRVVHRDLLLNFCAIWLIREDENPMTIDEHIHQQKITAFAKECQLQGNYFFFAMTGLAYISRWLNASELELNQLFTQAEESKRKMEISLNYLRSAHLQKQ